MTRTMSSCSRRRPARFHLACRAGLGRFRPVRAVCRTGFRPIPTRARRWENRRSAAGRRSHMCERIAAGRSNPVDERWFRQETAARFHHGVRPRPRRRPRHRPAAGQAGRAATGPVPPPADSSLAAKPPTRERIARGTARAVWPFRAMTPRAHRPVHIRRTWSSKRLGHPPGAHGGAEGTPTT